MQNPIK